MERKKEFEIVRTTYHFLEGRRGGGGDFCFIFEFLVDFRKYNIMILVIRSLSLSLSRTSSSFSGINVFETYETWTLGDSWINILRVISSLI